LCPTSERKRTLYTVSVIPVEQGEIMYANPSVLFGARRSTQGYIHTWEVFVRPSLYEGSAAFTRQSSSDRFLNPRNTYRIDHASQREEDES